MAEQPIPVTIESALAANHAALPWVTNGPTGGVIPATAQKTLVRLQLSSVTGVVMNVAIYGRDRWSHTSLLLTTITNLQGFTGGTTVYEVQNPERFDRIAAYVTGATWDGKTLNASMICSAMPAGDSATAAATAASVASIDAKTPALGSALAAASSPSTIATDDPHMGAVGAASDVDGVVHGQLRYAGEAAESSRALLSTIDADTGSIDTNTGAISAVEGATTDAAVTTDANGTISAKLRGWIVLLLLYLAQVGQAIKTYGLSIVVSDGTNSRLLRGNTSGYLQPVPKYVDGGPVLTAAVADNNAPTLSTHGVAFQADTKDAYLEIWCINEEVGVSNVDINVYLYEPNSGTWNIPAGGALVDLQLQTNNRWGVKIPDARLQGTRVYVEVDNYVAGATTISISAVMTERTT